MKERNKPAYSALRRMLLHWGSILFFYLDRSSINPGTSGAQTVPVYRTHWKKAMPRQDKYFVPIGQFFDTIWEAVKKKETLFVVWIECIMGDCCEPLYLPQNACFIKRSARYNGKFLSKKEFCAKKDSEYTILGRGSLDKLIMACSLKNRTGFPGKHTGKAHSHQHKRQALDSNSRWKAEPKDL